MTSRISAHDNTQFRVIAPGFGELGTLASIYAFGLTDNPASDNVFGMPAGNLAFPGRLNRGAHQLDAAVEYYQNRSDLVSPAAYERVSMAANLSGIGGAGGGVFRINELNDPSWNGTFAALDVPWIIDEAIFSLDATQTNDHAGTVYQRRQLNPAGASPFTIPNTTTGGNALFEQTELFSSTAGAMAIVERQTGYGQSELLLQSVVNGASGQWLTHWNNGAIAPAAGDGPAWIIDADGRFNHNSPVAALQSAQLASSPVGPWSWNLIAYDGVTLHTVAQFNNTIATTRAPLFSGGPTTDPFGGGGLGGFYGDSNSSKFAVIANENTTAAANASASLALLCGSFDGSIGALGAWTINSTTNAASVANLGGGPQTAAISHSPNGIRAPLDFYNNGGDIRFGGPGGGAQIPLIIDNTNHRIKFGQGIIAPGAVAVAITNAPAGVGAAPAEYLEVRNAAGAVRYIPLLG